MPIAKTPPNHLLEPSHQKSIKYMFMAFFFHWTKKLNSTKKRRIHVGPSYLEKQKIFAFNPFPQSTH